MTLRKRIDEADSLELHWAIAVEHKGGDLELCKWDGTATRVPPDAVEETIGPFSPLNDVTRPASMTRLLDPEPFPCWEAVMADLGLGGECEHCIRATMLRAQLLEL